MGIDVKLLVAGMKKSEKKEKKVEVKLPETVLAVATQLFADRKRMTYAQWNCLCVAASLIKKAGPASFPMIGKLPKEQQYLVTNNDGSYHANAIKKWGDVVEVSRKADPISSDEDFIALVTSKAKPA